MTTISSSPTHSSCSARRVARAPYNHGIHHHHLFLFYTLVTLLLLLAVDRGCAKIQHHRQKLLYSSFDDIIISSSSSNSNSNSHSYQSTRHRGTLEDDDDDILECVCPIFDLPDLTEKAATARWLAHTMEWGVISSISTRLNGDKPIPFGNVYSFVDGPCDNATGTPYLYGTSMDQSFSDLLQNPAVSLTLTEASFSSLQSSCWKKQQQQQQQQQSSSSAAPTGITPFRACRVAPHVSGDPENPVCARVVLTGRFDVLERNSLEWEFAVHAFFQRHPSMKDWPEDHDWHVAAIRLQDVWLLDYFGGATLVSVSNYYQAQLKIAAPPPSPPPQNAQVEEEERLDGK